MKEQTEQILLAADEAAHNYYEQLADYEEGIKTCNMIFSVLQVSKEDRQT